MSLHASYGLRLILFFLQLSKVFRLRSVVTQCFRDHYFSRNYVEVREREKSMVVVGTHFTHSGGLF